jgi:hypothetical protein
MTCQWAILCSACQALEDGTATIHRVFSTITVVGVPQLLAPVAVAVSLVGVPSESGTLTIRVSAPENRETLEASGPSSVDLNGRLLTWADFSGLTIEAAGECTISVHWNDELIHRVMCPVWNIGSVGSARL